MSEAERTIILERTFNAPRALVFKVWTDPAHLVHWWGPNGFTTTYLESDVRTGGRSRFLMHAPDGTDFPNRMDFTEVVVPEKLVFEHGNDIDDDPGKFWVTTTFEDLGDNRTHVKQRMVLPTVEAYHHVLSFGAVELGKQTFEKAATYLEKLA